MNEIRPHHALLPGHVFYRRFFRSFALGALFILLSLLGGMCGYHYLENLPWVDSFVNAAMILSGMGPLSPLQTVAGKIFAGCYALYSGLALLTTVGLVLAPLVHRALHNFHLEGK